MTAKTKNKSNKDNKIKKKYYAIKEGKNTKNKIVTTLNECKELVLDWKSN